MGDVMSAPGPPCGEEAGRAAGLTGRASAWLRLGEPVLPSFPDVRHPAGETRRQQPLGARLRLEVEAAGAGGRRGRPALPREALGTAHRPPRRRQPPHATSARYLCLPPWWHSRGTRSGCHPPRHVLPLAKPANDVQGWRARCLRPTGAAGEPCPSARPPACRHRLPVRGLSVCRPRGPAQEAVRPRGPESERLASCAVSHGARRRAERPPPRPFIPLTRSLSTGHVSATPRASGTLGERKNGGMKARINEKRAWCVCVHIRARVSVACICMHMSVCTAVRMHVHARMDMVRIYTRIV